VLDVGEMVFSAFGTQSNPAGKGYGQRPLDLAVVDGVFAVAAFYCYRCVRCQPELVVEGGTDQGFNGNQCVCPALPITGRPVREIDDNATARS
jgi:hypothetical protein